MNLGVLAGIPSNNLWTQRPQKMSTHGNVYKIALTHNTEQGIKNYEVWTTKEAVQKHYDGMKQMPKNYQFQKFAKQTYEKELRSKNGVLPHEGILVTSDDVSYGNPKLWPATISHPEVKLSE